MVEQMCLVLWAPFSKPFLSHMPCDGPLFMQEKPLVGGAPSSELSYYQTIMNQGHVNIQQQVYHGKPHFVFFNALD